MSSVMLERAPIRGEGIYHVVYIRLLRNTSTTTKT